MGFPQRNLLAGSQVWTGDPGQDAQSSQEAFDALTLALQQLKNRTVWGVTDGSNALPGQIGEYIESSASGVGSWSSGVDQNITSVTLTAGDWDVEASARFDAVAITGTQTVASISTTSATLNASYFADLPAVPTASAGVTLPIARRRVSISSTTTVYLTGRIVFTVGTPTAQGRINARRVR